MSDHDTIISGYARGGAGGGIQFILRFLKKQSTCHSHDCYL